MKSLYLIRLCCLLLMAVLVLTIGCDDNGDTTGPNQPASVDTIIAQANDMLSVVMADMRDQTDVWDSTFQPASFDFRPVYDKYKEALGRDANDLRAKFGVAMTGMAIILSDTGLNRLYDDFYEIYDDTVPSTMITGLFPEVHLLPNSRTPGIPTSGKFMGRVLANPMRVQTAAVQAAVNDSLIGDLQRLLNTELMPKVQEALDYLDDVLAEPSFEFYVSPEMQGNPGADTIVFDHTDFLAFKAALLSARAGLHVFFSRNFDLTQYNIEGIEAALQQTSDFATLTDDGPEHLDSALADIISAEAVARQALLSLIAEVQSHADQMGDFLTVDRDDDTVDLREIVDTIQKYNDYLAGPEVLSVDWGRHVNCTGGGCVSVLDTLKITVDVRRFFTDPANSLLGLLPDYTLSLEDLSDYQAVEAAHFSISRFWSRIHNLYGTTSQSDAIDSINWYFYEGYTPLPEQKNDAYYALLSSFIVGRLYTLGWDDAELQSWCWDERDLWCYWSSTAHLFEEGAQGNWPVEMCLTWDAADYATWTWPDPTFAGLFPNMTQADLKAILYDDPWDWEQPGCDTLEILD